MIRTDWNHGIHNKVSQKVKESSEVRDLLPRTGKCSIQAIQGAVENLEKESLWEIGKICVNTCLDAAYKSKQSNVEGLYEVGCVMT